MTKKNVGVAMVLFTLKVELVLRGATMMAAYWWKISRTGDYLSRWLTESSTRAISQRLIFRWIVTKHLAGSADLYMKTYRRSWALMAAVLAKTHPLKQITLRFLRLLQVQTLHHLRLLLLKGKRLTFQAANAGWRLFPMGGKTGEAWQLDKLKLNV